MATTRKREAAPARQARTSPARANASAEKAPARRKAPPAGPARPGGATPERGAHLGSRLVGAVLLAGAVLVGLSAADIGPSAPLETVRSILGLASPVALALCAALALLLLGAPGKLARPHVLRAITGAAVLLLACVTLLGSVGRGGAVGAAVWDALAAPLGAGALLVICAAVVAGLVLTGVPPAAMLRVVRAMIGLVQRALFACVFGLVGAVVWLVRRRETPPPVGKPASVPGDRRKPARPAPVPPPTDAPSEATQPMLPVIRKVVDEPPKRTRAGVADHWALPPIDMLAVSEVVEVSEVEAHERARVIERTLQSFGVEAAVREINPGPRVTQFALEPGAGTKVSRITSLKDDLALALAAPSIRVEAPVPGQSRVGLEIPNGQAAFVRLRDVFDSGAFHNSKGTLRLALGRDVTGRSVVGDLARMPHLLIAGATGAGKSACLNSIIAGLLFQHTPDELRFLMVDPKMVELKTFDGVPHLVWPVVTEMDKVVGVLKYAVGEMERRYKEFSELGIRNLDGYNKRCEAAGQPKLPRMIVIIDELADLMMAAPEEVEAAICRLAQMARAVGIHLILATQRPSVDVLTGLIKANFPSRIAFAVSSQIDSRVILDAPGAERLLGRGDMLFLGPDSPKPLRVQGAWVTDDEVEAVVRYWRDLQPAEYDPEVGRHLEAESRRTENPHEDPLYAQALELVQGQTRISTSLLQRKLRIGYNRASRLMDMLRDSGDLDVELDD